MDEPRAQSQPVCAQEALDLLNCVTQSPFDQDKCNRLLLSLRECVLSKVLNLSENPCFMICLAVLWFVSFVVSAIRFD